jgi:site-specific recombinase XerD
MKRDYLHNGEYRLALEMKKATEELSEPNISYVLAYSAKLGLLNRKPQTLARIIRELRYILQFLGKDVKTATKEDIERLVAELNKSEKAPISKNKIKQTLRSFYKWLLKTEEYPSIVKWVKMDRVESIKLPEELLTEEDIAKLIEACKSQRDKTIIALLYDTGMRVGELLNLKIRDIVLNKDSPSYVMVDGKTGKRRATLVFSVPYLANYLDDGIKERGNDTSLFFTTYGNQFDYDNVRKLLSDLKERTGMKKRLHPHLFRHSRASIYANSMTEQQLKKYFGWTGGSQMAGVYVHLSGKDVDDAVLKANGIIDNKGEPIRPKLTVKECHKCHDINEATAKYCIKCGSPLDITPTEQVNESELMKKKLDDLTEAFSLLIEKIDPQTKSKILEFIKK